MKPAEDLRWRVAKISDIDMVVFEGLCGVGICLARSTDQIVEIARPTYVSRLQAEYHLYSSY